MGVGGKGVGLIVEEPVVLKARADHDRIESRRRQAMGENLPEACDMGGEQGIGRCAIRHGDSGSRTLPGS